MLPPFDRDTRVDSNSASLSFRRGAGTLRAIGLLRAVGGAALGFGLMLSACKGGADAAAQTRTEPPALNDKAAGSLGAGSLGAGSVAAAEKAEKASPRADADAYSVRLELSGDVKLGQATKARLVLQPKAPFHCNAEYPYKFKLDPSDGLGLAADSVGKEQGQVTPEMATFDIALTPKVAGPHTLSGTFAFSVCKDDQCLVERKQLALPIVVVAGS